MPKTPQDHLDKGGKPRDEQEEIQLPAVTTKEIRRINTPFAVSAPAPDGSQEISYITDTDPFGRPKEIETFVISKDAVAQLHEKTNPASDLVVAPAGSVPGTAV